MNSNPSDSNRPTTAKRVPNRIAKWWFVVVGAVSLLAVIYISTRVFGRVSGVEFSPDLFQRRSFTYYQIPLVQLQITPIYRENISNSLEQYLVASKLVPSSAATAPRWDLVRAAHGTGSPHLGDAEILCAYLDASDQDGGYVWKKWSEKNRQLAQILWGAVDRLADQRLYLLLPEVFSLATRSDQASNLEIAIAETLADRYAFLARAQLEIGDRQSAVPLIKEGLRLSPEHAALSQLLKESTP